MKEPIELSHVHIIDNKRLFASFIVSYGNTSAMHTFGYDGEWFFVGGGSAHYNISEVGCNANKAGGNHFYHKPNRTELAIDYIFQHNRVEIKAYPGIVSETITNALMCALRDFKIDSVVNL